MSQHYFNIKVPYSHFQIWLRTMWCLWAHKGSTAHRKAISFTSNRREHVRGAWCWMDSGNKQPFLPCYCGCTDKVDWACWRVITRVSFNRLPTMIYHYGYEYSLYCISIVASPAAPWFTELCLCWHLLNSHGLLQIPLHLSVYVCMHVCRGEAVRNHC